MDTSTIHQAVDLGLSSKWSTCNLGAESPEEYGYYFAWGETEPKSTYDIHNYRCFEDDKYGIAEEFVKNSPKVRTTLDLEDDVAHLSLGKGWRIPNLNDISDLFEKCHWRKTTRKGVKGYVVTSMVEGFRDQSIFLPNAGFIIHSQHINIGYAGYYWSSSLYLSNAKYAISTVFDFKIRIKYLPYNRNLGLPIRPVCD